MGDLGVVAVRQLPSKLANFDILKWNADCFVRNFLGTTTHQRDFRVDKPL